jgi:hypothetical protein
MQNEFSICIFFLTKQNKGITMKNNFSKQKTDKRVLTLGKKTHTYNKKNTIRMKINHLMCRK